MQHTNAVRKPVGGFVFMTVRQLCRVWVAYEQRRIKLVDVWVWWAAHEVVAKRCQAKPDQQRCYRVEELDRLVGSAHSMPQSLRRLAQAGLLCWNEEQITFPEEATSMDEFQALNAMLEQIPNHQRRVPVPRRIIRYLAGGCRRVRMATVLGHLLRCLYYRAGQCCPHGHCKAPWIATVFGVGLRQVKRARRQLEQLGLLQRHDAPQWVLNRYGADLTINLQWDSPPHDDDQHGPSGLPGAAVPAVPSSLVDRSDSVASPAAFTEADASTSMQVVRADTADQQEPQTDCAPAVAFLPRALAPVEAEGTRSTHEPPQVVASTNTPRSLVAQFEQARADIRAGRVPRTDDAPVVPQRLRLSHAQMSGMSGSPAAVETPTAQREELCGALSAPPLLQPLVQEAAPTDQGMLRHDDMGQRPETQTNTPLHNFQPIQAVLSTLQLPTVSSPIVDHPRSTDAARVGAGAAPCSPLEQAVRNDTPASCVTPSEMTPPSDPKHHEMTPPDSDRELSQREEKDQKPAARDSAGVFTAMVRQARAEVKAGVRTRSAQRPVLNPPVSATLNKRRASRGESTAPAPSAQQSAGVPAVSTLKATAQPTQQAQPAALPPPTLRHILVQDLRNTERLLQLYKQAVTAGLISHSEADRLNFVALAHHVLSYRPENPGGLFTQLLRKRHFDYITQDDEDAAQRRLTRVLYGGTVPVLHDDSAIEHRRAG